MYLKQKEMKMKPKAVLISDIHYNINNLEVADAALNLAIAKSNELQIPIIIAGDLNDTKGILRAECVNTIINTIKKAWFSTYVLIGNHDLINEKGYAHSLEFLTPHCTVVDKPRHDKQTGLWMLPYCSDSEVFKRTLSIITEPSTIICHQGIKGASMGDYLQDKSSIDPILLDGHRYVSGHYHRMQTIQCGKTGVFDYIGSPYTVTFGEANDGPKGFRVLYEDNSLELIPTNLRKHVVINRTICDLYDPIVDLNSQDIIWLKVTGLFEELSMLNKQEIGICLFGKGDYRFDIIPIKSGDPTVVETIQSSETLFDSIIDNLKNSEQHKNYLKAKWREILHDSR